MKAVANNVIRLAKKNKKAIPKIKSNTPLKRGKRKVGSKNKIVTPKPVEAPFKYTGEIPSRVPVANPSNPKGGGGYSGGSKLGYPLNQGGGGSRVIPPKKIIQPPTRPPMKGPEHYDNSKPVDFTKMPTTYEPIPVGGQRRQSSGAPTLVGGMESPNQYKHGGMSELDARNKKINLDNRDKAMSSFSGMGTSENMTGGYLHGQIGTPDASGTMSKSKDMSMIEDMYKNKAKNNVEASNIKKMNSQINKGYDDHKINTSTDYAQSKYHRDPEFSHKDFRDLRTDRSTWAQMPSQRVDIDPFISPILNSAARPPIPSSSAGAKGNFGKLKDRYNGLSDNQKLGVAAFGAGVAGVAVGSFLNRDRGRV